MALPLAYNIRNLRQRWKVTLLAVIGIGLVVGVFVTLLAMENGFRIALRSTGSPLNGIITQRGSTSELTSWINVADAQVIAVDPHVARDSNGKPMSSCEVVILANKPRRSDGQPANITFRGVSPMVFNVRNNVKIVEGRNFSPGLYEVIVGKKMADRVTGLNIGDTISVQRHVFKVVGLFTAEGSSFESEIWGDFDAMGPAIGRNGGCSSMTVRMSNPAILSAFDKEVRANPRVQLEVDSEPKYYEDQAGPVAGALIGLAAFVAVVMGIGAVFGAMNTMYAIVSQRTREIGTLRALGFSRLSILVSFVLESVILALIGGVLGCLLAFTMNGYTAGTGQTQSFSEMAFAFRITPPVLIFGIVFAVLMGFVGGLLPAFRAARMPITRALREA